MKHCPNKNTPTAVGVSPENGLATAHKLGCKQWNCPYCSTKRKYFYARKCYLGIGHYQANGAPNWYFGTITMHENWRGWASIINYQQNWNKFYQRMRRATDGPLCYCLLPEHHKEGSLHVHIISTCQQETRWWKDEGRSCGFGYKNENVPLESTPGAVFYVTKYIGKSVGVASWPKNFRRVRFSVSWPEPPHNDEWSWSAFPPDLARDYLFKRVQMGYQVINSQTGEITHYEPYIRRDKQARAWYDSDVQE